MKGVGCAMHKQTATRHQELTVCLGDINCAKVPLTQGVMSSIT
jgi:hypothetical protein